MKCPYKPRWFDKRMNFYSIIDYTLIDGKIIMDKIYIGYLNIFNYRFRLKLYVEKVR